MNLTPLERALLAKVPPGATVPLYGSPEFDASDDVVVRAASVIRAAAAWRDHCSPAQVALDLLEELERQERELARRVREGSWDVAGQRDWVAAAGSPSFVELQQRRAS